MKINKAVIPAAGFGTRVLPSTKSMPKEMYPLIDRPTIDYIVREAVDSGIKDILVITSRGKNTIEDYFDESPELEKSLENGSALEWGEYTKEEAPAENLKGKLKGTIILTLNGFLGYLT